MDTLKRVLAVMVFILVVLVGAGLYYTQTMNHAGGGHTAVPNQTGEQPKTGQAPAKQSVNVVLQPDLRVYIDEINKGISLINEANGLITADPFFSDPPEVPRGRLETTPFDKLIPKDDKNSGKPILILPDGTYQVVDNNGVDMRDIHRGIYKLGQGMTVLNSALDRMNQDIRNNNFPVWGSNTQGTAGNVPYYNPYMPNMNMTNTNMAHGTDTGITGLFNLGSGTFSTIIYMFLIGFVILAIFSVIGFVLSLFRPGTDKEPRPE